ncbi:MAG: pseudoazurin [Gammaproteobacteria bacterium]|nr:pseudoazurin [Gammaproteobacteria bacterium]
MKKVVSLAAMVFFLVSHQLKAEEHVIKAVGLVFEPLFVFAQPGDTITWTNMPAHMVESIESMMPADAEKMLSPIGETYTYTVVEQSGIHMYKCTPHWGARMGGGIVIGSPENAAEILDAYMEVIETDGALKPAKGLIKKLRKEMEERGVL